MKHTPPFLILAALMLLAPRVNAQPKVGSVLPRAEPVALTVQVVASNPFGATLPKTVAKVRPGEPVWIQVNGTLAKGYHTYPITKKTSTQKPVSTLSVGKTAGITPRGPIRETEPIQVPDEADPLETVLEHVDPFMWAQELLVAPDAALGKIQVPIEIKLQVCNSGNCQFLTQNLKASFEIAGEPTQDITTSLPPPRDPAVSPAVTAVPSVEVKELKPPSDPSPTPASKAAKTEKHEPIFGLISDTDEEYKAKMEALAKQIVKPDTTASTDLWSFLLAGIFWGAISLITPCVFPMIPITVSYFLKQSEKENYRPIVMASVYSLTIVVVLTLAAAFLLSIFRWLSIHPATNYFLGALFVFFALSLFGMYEIELPNSLARFTSSREGRGGLVGTMFMALTFTIISFACVAPFLGGFGGTAAAARPVWQNILGGLAFSATFAAPFFFLALFPSMLRALPKSGAWLNSVKVVMGFLELAAALKFLRAAELAQTAGAPSLLTFDLVLGIWIALSVLSGLYLIGLFRLPHDTPVDNIGVPRLMFSIAFLGLALYLTPALFKAQRPAGAVYAWIDSFLLPDAQDVGTGQGVTANLPYAVADLREWNQKHPAQPKRIFLDITGVLCTNCKINERSVFSLPEVEKLLHDFTIVQLYADLVPKRFYTSELSSKMENAWGSEEAAQINQAFERAVFDEVSQPLYAVFEPLPDGRVKLIGRYDEGRINDPKAFADFLRNPEKWQDKK